MAFHLEGADIVINGWEEGISDNPYKGINDMRGVNIVSIPGEASVSFAQVDKKMPSVTATISSVDTTADTITFTGRVGLFNSYQCITFTGASLPGGLTAGTLYWVNLISSNTIQVFTNPFLNGTQVDITSSGTGTAASVNMAAITYFERTTGVALDASGRAWTTNVTGGSIYSYLGNPVSGTAGLAGTVGNGLIWYKEYLFVFYNSRICYLHFPSNGGYYDTATWVNEWDPTTGAANPGTAVFNTPTGTGNPHEAIVGINDDVVYITDSDYIASLFENAGQTFDPATPATYSWAKQALQLPAGERANCLAELGNKLLIGGQFNCIYTWNRTSTNRDNALLIAENGITHMITINTNTYVFAGKRGRIYVTNGSQAQLYVKVPDHISGIDPIFTWNNVGYNKNQLYFGVSCQDNDQTANNDYVGLWAVDITTNALRCVTLQSDPLGTVTAVYPQNSGSGFMLNVAWKHGTVYGIDESDDTPYADYVSYIDTEILPVGQYLYKRTFQNVEFKLSAPLVAGEGIKISYRTNRSGSYTQVGETTTAGAISDVYSVNFDQVQWLQFRVEMKSTATAPSYVRLTEIRIR